VALFLVGYKWTVILKGSSFPFRDGLLNRFLVRPLEPSKISPFYDG